MSRSGLQSIVLVLGLVIANCRCLAACMTEPNHDYRTTARASREVPPCHQQSTDGDPVQCTHATLLADSRTPALTSSEFEHTSSFPPVRSAVPSLPDFTESTVRQASPPGSPELAFSTVLRT
jgi:hypothetical protein